MELMYENDYGEKLQYIVKYENGCKMIHFYFTDSYENKTLTKKISIDFLAGGTY